MSVMMNGLVSVFDKLHAVSLIDRALGLERLSWSRQDLLLGWRYELPAWVWVLMALAAMGCSWWGYSRMLGRVGPRVMLAGVRVVLFMFIAAVLAGPLLVLKQERVEPDWLVMLVDRSASMQIQDTDTQTPSGPTRISRAEALRQAITQQADLFGPEALGKDRRLLWLGFDAQAYPIDPPYLDPESAGTPGTPQGRVTALRTAIEQSLQRTAGRPVSGIVLWTDGRSPQPTGADLIHRLRQQAVSVFPVPLGASKQPVDLSLARIDAPDKAFVNDAVPITVWVAHDPADVAVDGAHVRVRLIDAQTGDTLDERSPDAGLSEPVRLLGESSVAGPVKWRVELEYEPPATEGAPNRPVGATNELITENNHQEVALELIDRPIRVLYVEGYPRWEYRYLKNVLVRERSIESSILLLSGDRDFAQEGDQPITRLPNDYQELKAFDVVIIGDVPSDYFTLEQRTMLRDYVALHGAGLLWIGGAYHTPYSYDATRMADLLPMRRPGMTELFDAAQGSLMASPTPLARALNLFSLSTPDAVSRDEGVSDPRWPANLPGLLWAQVIAALKPSVDVLATASMSIEESPIPLVMRLRYGAGQSVYVATDDTWRWRYGRGDVYFQRFWVQLVRMLGRHRIREDTGRVQLSVSHRRIELGQTVVVELHVGDAMLLERDLPRVAVSVARTASMEGAADRLERLELLPQPQTGADVANGESSENQRVYRAAWRPSWAGQLTLRVVEPALEDLNITLPIEVIHPEDELRHPMPDHDRLVDLAELTGGQVVWPDRLDELAGLIPNRARRTPDDISESLWDSPLTLIIIMGLLTVEWVGRKVIQLA